MAENRPTVETLQRLRPLAEFNTEQLQALALELTIHVASKNEEILELGSVEDCSLFILEGDVRLISRDGKQSVRSVANFDPINPIAQLRPSMYAVESVKKVAYIKIPKQKLTEYSAFGTQDEIDSVIVEENPTIDLLTMKIYTDMMADTLSLPSLPEMALKIQRVYQDDLADLDTISNVLMSDPAMSAKLIKIANSVVYQGEVPTETLKAAISRLGLEVTYKQVMAYAVNDLFNSQSELLKDKMTDLWAHSRKVAAISHLLAKETKLFNPELAMLAGLVHDLGVIVILEYLEKADSIDDDLDSEIIVRNLRPVVTGMLMKKWNFTDETVTVAEECEDWFRNAEDEADLCDLVLLAQYHSYIGTDDIKGLPPIVSIPAMKKLGLSPVDSIALMKQSKDKIKAMEAMLN